MQSFGKKLSDEETTKILETGKYFHGNFGVWRKSGRNGGGWQRD